MVQLVGTLEQNQRIPLTILHWRAVCGSDTTNVRDGTTSVIDAKHVSYRDWVQMCMTNKWTHHPWRVRIEELEEANVLDRVQRSRSWRRRERLPLRVCVVLGTHNSWNVVAYLLDVFERLTGWRCSGQWSRRLLWQSRRSSSQQSVWLGGWWSWQAASWRERTPV